MKKLLFCIVIGLVYIHSHAQGEQKMIRISKDIELLQLSEKAYVHLSYSTLPGFGRFASNGLIFINNGEALLFDTPVTDSLTMELVSWLTDSMNIKIVGFMPNHWHADCMGGLGFLKKQKIESYANQMTINIAAAKKLPIPAHGFKDSLQLKLGDKVIDCLYPGAAHSKDNIVVWIPSEQILFAGCMVKSMDARNLGNMADGDPVAYPKTIDRVIDKFPNAKIVIPGHGQCGGLELLQHTKELTEK